MGKAHRRQPTGNLSVCPPLNVFFVQVDLLGQIRQLDQLISQQREMIIRSRGQFEDEFYCIKDLIDTATLVTVDKRLTQFQQVKEELLEASDLRFSILYRLTGFQVRRRLREQAALDPALAAQLGGPGGGAAAQRDQHSADLLAGERRYLQDLETVLAGYRDHMLEQAVTHNRTRFYDKVLYRLRLACLSA